MVRSMWLFKHKFLADGTLSCYKARLVANDSSQQLGVNFDETFSLVVKSATIHMVLSLVVSRKWPIHQLDVKNAFLNGDLSETIYMHQPTSFVDASRCDSSLFIYRQGSQVAYLLLYVDDIILTASSTILLKQLIDSLHHEFDMTDLGALNYFLGISAVPNSTSLFLSQRNSTDCLYIHDPREPHAAALKRILRYVQDTLDLGLHLYASSTTPLVGYTDADWAGCPSTSSAVYMSANPVQHQQTKQIKTDIHFVRDMVIAGQVRALHVHFRYQYADIFTKGLSSALFEEFQSSLSVRPPLTPTAGAY
uniref:Ribonuclease H-like domain-containing protein n=1 Tax=Tanacetum cinerariifolium TaxID=118510 RepID=A0A6L2JX73_TANCI|nr:ribonuclease H-like domain-containing protein [Tanacetum cinerariifolium]